MGGMSGPTFRGNNGATNALRGGALGGGRAPMSSGAMGNRSTQGSFLTHHAGSGSNFGNRGGGLGTSLASRTGGLGGTGLGHHGAFANGGGNSFSTRHSQTLLTNRGNNSFGNNFNNFGGRYNGYGGGFSNRGYGYGYGYPYSGFGYGSRYGYGLGGGLLSSLLFGYGGYGYGGYGRGYGGYGGYGGGYCYPNYGYSGYSNGLNYTGAADYPNGVGANQYAAVVTNVPTSAISVHQPQSASTAGGFAEQGETSFKAGDYKGAVYAWRHATVDNSQNPVLMLMLGQALFATGNFEEAAGATHAALSQLPKDQWGVVVSNTRELYGSLQDYTTQLRALEQAAKDKPNDPALRLLMGYHYAYLGYPQQAVDQLDKGLSLAPQDEIAKQLRDEMRAKLPQPTTPALQPIPGALTPAP